MIDDNPFGGHTINFATHVVERFKTRAQIERLNELTADQLLRLIT